MASRVEPKKVKKNQVTMIRCRIVNVREKKRNIVAGNFAWKEGVKVEMKRLRKQKLQKLSMVEFRTRVNFVKSLLVVYRSGKEICLAYSESYSVDKDFLRDSIIRVAKNERENNFSNTLGDRIVTANKKTGGSRRSRNIKQEKLQRTQDRAQRILF